MEKDTAGQLYDLFADLLAYPTPAIQAQAAVCLAQLRKSHPQSAAALERFSQIAGQLSTARLEELYTGTFDMQPLCYPYVGYQLFGESYKRGAFMAQLNEAYHAFGYDAGNELPDHVALILRFLGLDSANRQGNFCQALLKEGLLPALVKMRQAFGEPSENPYASLLAALHLFFIQTPEKEFDHA